jgi:hypothetical protein
MRRQPRDIEGVGWNDRGEGLGHLKWCISYNTARTNAMISPEIFEFCLLCLRRRLAVITLYDACF